MEKYLDISLDEISFHEKLSTHAISVCRHNKLHTLYAILNYYRDHVTFTGLSGCGTKTNNELVALCSFYLSEDAPDPSHLKAAVQKSLHVESLAGKQKDLVQAFIRIVTESLRKYARITISALKLSSADLAAIPGYIREQSLHHVPQNKQEETAKEIRRFENNILAMNHALKRATPENFIGYYIRALLRIYHIDKPLLIDLIYNTLLIADQIAVFKLLATLIASPTFFRANEKAIFEHLYSVNGNTADEVRTTAALSREKFEHLQQGLEKRLAVLYSFLPLCELHKFTFVTFVPTDTLIIIHDKLANEYNRRFALKFNTRFYYTVLRQTLAATHYPYYGYNVLTNNTSLQPYFLIDKALCNTFNVDAFLAHIQAKIKEIRFEPEQFHILSCMGDYYFIPGGARQSEIKSMVKLLLYHEFNLPVMPSGHIILPVNFKGTLAEFIYTNLNEIGKVSTLKEILAYVEKKHPAFHVKRKEWLHTLLSEKKAFFDIGKPRRFGIVSWEREKKQFPGRK